RRSLYGPMRRSGSRPGRVSVTVLSRDCPETLVSSTGWPLGSFTREISQRARWRASANAAPGRSELDRGSGHHREEEERSKDDELHRALHDAGAPGTQRHRADDEGEDEQGEILGLEAQDDREVEDLRGHDDRGDGQADGRQGRAQREVHAGLEPVGAGSAHGGHRLRQRTSNAIAIPMTASGAPAALTAASMLGESTLASPTTPTSETRSSPRLLQAAAVVGGGRCSSSLLPSGGRK